MARHRDIPAVLMGSSRVRKTAFLTRLHTGLHTPTTISTDYTSEIVQIAGKTVKLQLWATTDSPYNRSSCKPICRIVSICVLFYAINDKSSFEALDSWRNTFLQYAQRRNAEQVPIVLEETRRICREIGQFHGVQLRLGRGA